MRIDHLLAQLNAQGIQLSRDGDRLRYRPKGRLTPELAAAVRAHKAELLALLACDTCARWPLLLPETRATGRCLRCMPPEQYLATIKMLGERRRHTQGDIEGSLAMSSERAKELVHG